MSQFLSFLFLVVSLIFIAFLVSFAVYSFRNRKFEGAILYATWLLFIGGWLFVKNLIPYLPENSIPTGLSMELIFLSFMPTIYLLYMLRFTSHKNWLNSFRQAILFLIPFITISFGLLNDFKSLIWKNVQITSFNNLMVVDYEFGYWFNFFWLISFGIYAFVFYELVRIDKLPINIENSRSILIKISGAIAMIASLFAVFPAIQSENLVIISLSFAISGLLIGFSLYQYQLFDLSPFIYHTLLENLHDGIIVINQDLRILQINNAAKSIIGMKEKKSIGSTAQEVLPAGSPWLNVLQFRQNELITKNSLNENLYFEILFTPLDEENRSQKQLILIQDVSSHRISKLAEQSAREIAEVRARELDVLRNVAERLNQSVEKKAVLSIGLETIVTLIGARFGYVVLTDEFSRPGLAGSFRLPEEVQEAFNSYPICPACKSFERLLNGEYQEPITFMPCRVLFDISVSYPGLISIPLILGEKPLGFLNLVMAPEVIFSGDEINLLQTLGDQFSAAIERARIYEQFEQLAMIDALTGLYNRRQLYILGENEFSRAYRYNHPISVIMLDIDLFKKVNDVYGHMIGDQVLQQIANRCRSVLRSSDIIGRYGGEEFVILLPETNVQLAQRIANRIRLLVLDRPIMTDRGEISVTVSMGISSMEGECDSKLEWVVDQADQALLQAKETGRNKVIIWQENQLSLYN
ncbi:MAG TPA: diguanylate cyclase [Anaerolineaceae bacterium]|nr:diguanylate cyclase [Anaerolineaceae bacterium]